MEQVRRPLHLAGKDRAINVEITSDGFESLPHITDGAFEYTQTRVIDVSPDALEKARIVAGRDQQDPVTNAYKLLRTQVLQRMLARGWQTVAVVSPAAEEGKTLTAINLAISLAATRSNTALLVDLDWRQPSVHKYFDYVPEHDIYDYLSGDRTLPEALVSPGLPRFCFLPCRAPVPGASEQLGALGGFVKELKGRYANRIVLFDLPPLLATDDAIAFLPLVDCALLVVEEGRSKREDVVRSVDLIGAERLLGTVLNKSSHRPAAY